MDIESTILLIYASLGPVAFFLANAKERKEIVEKMKRALRWLNLFSKEKVTPAPPENQKKIFDTEKYVVELQDLWN